MKKIPLVILLLPIAFLLSIANVIIGQSVIATSGGGGTVGNMHIDYTVGEAAISTLENDSMVLSQGFHQPFYRITAIKETFLHGTVSVFPNPTTSILNVKFENLVLKDIVVSLYDAEGKIISTARVDNAISQMDLSNLPNGYYILTVMDNVNQNINSYKILKFR